VQSSGSRSLQICDVILGLARLNRPTVIGDEEILRQMDDRVERVAWMVKIVGGGATDTRL